MDAAFVAPQGSNVNVDDTGLSHAAEKPQDGAKLPISPRHAAALAYAEIGVPVFPCVVGRKEPATTHGFKDATTDAAQINAWWTDADYNLALCPEEAGWCVVDLDGAEGIANWESLGIDTPTYTVATPSGGKHLYFAGSLPASASRLAPKIDTRGKGSYVLVPPSTVDGKLYRSVDSRLPVPLPTGVSERLDAAERPRAMAPEGIELDTADSIERARTYLAADICRYGAPQEGEGSDNRGYCMAAKLKDLGVSQHRSVDLLVDHWAPHFDADWLAAKVASAWRNGQNEPGAYAAGGNTEAMAAAAGLTVTETIEAPQPAKPDLDIVARLTAKFLPTPPDRDAEITTTSMATFIYAAKTPAPRRDLVKDWIEVGLLLVAGRGGVHKSRLIMQLCFALLYRRQWVTTGAGPGDECKLSGIAVKRIEFVSYEDEREEVERRVFEMRQHFPIPAAAADDDRADGWQHHDLQPTKPPLLVVSEAAAVKITSTGYKMLQRWEKLAEEGEHMVIWLDSLINAVCFEGNSKNIDACVDAAIATLMLWCKTLNASILAPFHTSRAGEARGDTGFSPRFEDAPRQVVGVSAQTRKIRNSTRSEKTGLFRFEVIKWNKGKPGKKFSYSYDRGQVISQQPMDLQDDGNPIAAAALIILDETYDTSLPGPGKRDIERLADPALSDDDRVRIERKYPKRLRRDGRGWKFGEPNSVRTLGDDAQLVKSFRHATGNERATAHDFIAACERAVKLGLLGYRGASKEANVAKRAPAGFCAPVAQEGHDQGPELTENPW